MQIKLCFFDDFYIAARPGVTRRYFKAEKIGDFIDPDAMIQTYTSFFFDESVNKFRLYYEKPIEEYNDTEIRMLMLAEGDCVEDFTSGNVTITQVNGLNPEGVHGCGVFYNKDAKDENQRYILCANIHNVKRVGNAYFMATSKDGINFENITYPYKSFSDSYCGMYYNPHNKNYFAILRPSPIDRRIATMRSENLRDWTTPEVILHPTPRGDNMGVQYYSMGVNYIDGVFYALVWRYMTDLGQVDFSDMLGYMEVDLYYSHDGINFNPTGVSPVADRPLPPDFGCKQLDLLNICNDNKGRTVLCGIASRVIHGHGLDKNGTSITADINKSCVTVFYGARKDGFCALEGYGKKSVVYTKPFICDGGEMRVNFDARVGDLAVAVTTWGGTPYEGFSFDDCVPLTGEDTDRKVEWKIADLSSLEGKRIRFAFRLNGALLYTASFEGRPKLDYTQISTYDPRPEWMAE